MPTPESLPAQEIQKQIEALQAELAENPEDLFVKIALASALERFGQIDSAKKLYQEIVDRDRDGILGISAQKAIQTMKDLPNSSESESEAILEAPESIPDRPFLAQETSYKASVDRGQAPLNPWLQKFYNLPISTKQLFTFILVEVIALALVGTGALLLKVGLRSQLLKQSRAELEVVKLSYDTKINEMKFGYRENSENPILIEAVQQKNAADIFNSLFLDELLLNKIELVILVDAKTNIIANSGVETKNRQFNRNNLVADAIAKHKQISSSEMISYDELAQENPSFAELQARELGIDPATKPNFLIRYTVTPIENENEEVVGAIISGDVVKKLLVAQVNEILGNGYTAVYLVEAGGKLRLAAAQEKLDSPGSTDDTAVQNNVELSNTSFLREAIAAGGKTVSDWKNLNNSHYAMSAKALLNFNGQPIAILVKGTCVSELEGVLSQNLITQGLLLVLAFASAIFLARFLAEAIVKPIYNLRDSTQRFAHGEREARAEVFASDEVGELAIAFNAMADSISNAELEKEEQFRQRQGEIEAQRQEKEQIQKSISKLLSEIIETQQGNLTIQAQIESGEIGSIADAFNISIENLRTIVMQVQKTTTLVHLAARDNEASVQKLSNLSDIQVQAIAETLYSVREMGQSIYLVADSAKDAAEIARDALDATQTGEKMMSYTVSSIGKIRTSVAETSKKIKRLAESSQEISKIVNIIAGISEKTNILAFNASIEASRAGEHGHGFRVVADEVRRLAERVTESAKDIEQIVNAIQTDTSEVMQTMENSTNQVVVGTKLVSKTKQTLQKLAQLSQQIDYLLQSISTSTVSQTDYAQTVMRTMEDVVNISKSTSAESQTVFNSLQALVEIANELQNYVAQFQVEEK
jgi:twitching motility protein PilJ